MDLTRTFGIYNTNNRVDLALFSNGYTMYDPVKVARQRNASPKVYGMQQTGKHIIHTYQTSRFPRSVLKLDSYDSGKFRCREVRYHP